MVIKVKIHVSRLWILLIIIIYATWLSFTCNIFIFFLKNNIWNERKKAAIPITKKTLLIIGLYPIRFGFRFCNFSIVRNFRLTKFFKKILFKITYHINEKINFLIFQPFFLLNLLQSNINILKFNIWNNFIFK